MATYTEGNRITVQAGADLSAKQFYVVKLSSGKAVLAAAGTDISIGVLMNKPKSNGTAEVYVRNASGTGKVIAGGSISVGDKLTSDSNGKAVATTTGGDEVFGRAREAAASGDVFEYFPCFDRV